jgi:hypothetical protein
VENRPGLFTPQERGVEDWRLSHWRGRGEKIRRPLHHGGVLHQGEDHTVGRSGRICRRVVTIWPRPIGEVMDQMGAGGGDEGREGQDDAEGAQAGTPGIPAPRCPWQERHTVTVVVFDNAGQSPCSSRPHGVRRRRSTSEPLSLSSGAMRRPMVTRVGLPGPLFFLSRSSREQRGEPRTLQPYFNSSCLAERRF